MGKKLSVRSGMPMMDQKYQAEEDFRTLERAEEVREDSQRHKKALGHGQDRLKQISTIVQRAKVSKIRGKRGVVGRARTGR